MILKKKILHDKLTNAYNREFFDQNYKKFISEYSTSNSKLAIAMLDIDHFKLVNDNYGHDIGDQVLIQFVDTLHKNSRKNDILVRWGGEEFIMILKIDEVSNIF
jgi:diguanylate cyclase (GGDEF)-like protein